MKLYHGTNQFFKQFEQSKARILNDYYGGGVAYFTDNSKVALTYAKSMAKSKGGEKYVFEVDLSVSKIFDVDNEFTGKELKKFFTDKTVEDFARGAGLLKFGVDKYSVMSSLQLGNQKLTGEQVFKGLSSGMNKTAKAREKLIKLGYDALRYNGGVNMGAAIKHDVYITYDASNVKIVAIYMYDKLDNKYKKV